MLRRGLMMAASVLGSVSPGMGQETGDASRGRTYAERVCAECHATGKGDVQVAHPGIVSFRTIANMPGMTGRALTVWLQTPHPNMPNLIVPPDDRDDVIAYILSLKEKR
jgi:cytochrome c2